MSWWNNLMRRRQYQRDEDQDDVSPHHQPPPEAVVEEAFPPRLAKFPTKPAISFRDLFVFDKWQGLGWLHFLYLLGWWWNLLFGSLLTIYGLSSGRAGVALVSLVIGPLYFILATITLRVLVEVVMSLLLIPHILHSNSAPRQETLPFHHQPAFNMQPLEPTMAAPPASSNPFNHETSHPEEVDRMAV